MRKLGRWMMVGVASVAAAAGVLALGGRAEAAGGCLCPRIYAPVTCSNGRTYANPCIAKCNRATECEPIPWYTPQIPVAGKRSVLEEQQEFPN